jgi:hypothetical protein
MFRIAIVATSITLSCGGKSQTISFSEPAGDRVEGAQCAPVSACGGDLVGAWELKSMCIPPLPPLPPVPTCPASTVRIVPDVAGIAVYRADGTYTVEATFGASLALTLPASCLGSQTCRELEQRYRDEGRLKAVDCADAADGCLCMLTAGDPEVTHEEGTYTVSESHILTTSPAGVASSDAYCVEGGQLVRQLGKATLTAEKLAP